MSSEIRVIRGDNMENRVNVKKDFSKEKRLGMMKYLLA